MKILITGGSGFIGSHLIRRLVASGTELRNIDVKSPHNGSHHAYWLNCSLLDAQKLRAEITSFQPTHVVHLAADANMEGRSIEDYPVNVQGVTNLIEAIRQTRSVVRVIVTSSQHVRRPGSKDTEDMREYAPHMAYGESKVVTEELTKAADLPCCWTIIRPTNVWGMGHPYLVEGLWRLIYRGVYVHPSVDDVVRGYGFVDNVCWQIESLLTVPEQLISRRVFYVGDRNERQSDWINAFGVGLTGKKVRHVPRSVIRMLAWVGDAAQRFEVNFPMHSARFYNLTTDNTVPMMPIHELLGEPPRPWRDAVVATCSELKRHYESTR